MVIFCVIVKHIVHLFTVLRHLTKIPSRQLLYFPHLQNRDARNSFRFRSYANCRVAPLQANFSLIPSPATYPSNSFRCNTYGSPRKCCKQKTYGSAGSQLSPLDATLTKNRGEGPNSPGKEEFYGGHKTERVTRRSQTLSQSAKMESYGGGDTVSTEAVAARRHAGTHLPVTWWKLEMPTTTWHLQLN